MAESEVNIKITAQDKASPTIASVGKNLGKLGKELGSVQSAMTSLATGGLPGLARGLSTLTGSISGMLGPWGLLAGAAATAGGAFIGFGINAANAAEQLENMSAMTGLAAADLESLQRISEDAGLGTENLATSIGNLNRELASEEGGKFAKVLAALGGDIRDSRGEVKDAITVLDEMRSALLAVESPAERARLANAAMGKGLRELIPLLLNSAKSMREQIDAMKESGRVMDEQTQKNLAAFDDALDATKGYFERLGNAVKYTIGKLYEFFAATEKVPAMVAAGAMSLRQLVAALPGVPGKSPLEIQAEEEARARAIASGATGKELEIKLKIEDAERRMAAVHGEKQIPIAQEIAGYKQQLDLIKEQNKALEENKRKLEEIKRKLEEINDEGRRREAMAKIPALRESEFLMEKQPLPALLSPEEIQKTTEGITEGLQDASFRGLKASQKTTDEIFEYYTDQGIKSQRKIENMREDAFREHKRQYERMIDGIRDGAGRVFDAMLTKGESVFSSLAKFAEGVLQTMLRNIFQNAMTSLAASSGIMQKLLSGGGGGAGGGGAGALATGGLGAVGGFGGLGKLFGFGGGGGAATGGYAQSGGITYAAGGAAKSAGFATGAVGSALTAGGALAGQMVMMDAFRRGSALEGLAGGAMAGASIGTMIAPGIGTAIGAGVGAIAGLITGLFGGGAKRRAEEAAKRAAMIEAQQFAAPETITRYGTWGGPGEFAVEPDLTGQIRGIGRVPTVVVNVENNMIDARHAREAGEVIGQAVSQQILAGGSYLADNIAWAAGAP
jgi:hypothetical protein